MKRSLTQNIQCSLKGGGLCLAPQEEAMSGQNCLWKRKVQRKYEIKFQIGWRFLLFLLIPPTPLCFCCIFDNFTAPWTGLLHGYQALYKSSHHHHFGPLKRMVPCHQGCHCITIFQTLQRNYMPLTSLARRSYSSISLSFSWLTFSTLQMRLAAVSACWAPEKAW